MCIAGGHRPDWLILRPASRSAEIATWARAIRSAVVLVAKFDDASLLSGISGVRLERDPVRQLGPIRIVGSGYRFLVLLGRVGLWFVKASVGHGNPLWKSGSRPVRRVFQLLEHIAEWLQ